MSKLGCSNCTLDDAKLEHPKMVPTGSEKPELYFIGEAPGETEDEEGEQFVGITGQMIRSRIPSRWKNKIRWNNTIRCRPPENRNPSKLEIACCRRLQLDDIVTAKPKAVVGFGGVPLHWFIGEDGIRDVWRGRRLALRLEWKGDHHDFWYYPLWHPSFVNRMGGNSRRGSDWGDVFAHDLKRVFDDAEAGFEEPRIVTPEEMRSHIKCWKPGDDIQGWVNAILGMCRREATVGLDIETTGLLPYPEDAKILTMSLNAGEKETIAFPIDHPEANLRGGERHDLWMAIRQGLRSAKRVVCHSSQFEQEWLLVRGEKCTPEFMQKIKWGDTLGQAYTMDERKGSNSLDDLTLINFGIRVKELSNVDVSNLINEKLEDVLPYNGMDSKSCRMLWFVQRKEILKRGLRKVSDMHERRSLTVAGLMSRGLTPNWPAIHEFNEEYSERLETLEEKIQDLSEVKAFAKANDGFNPGTPDDVKKVLNSSGYAVDDTKEETLSTIKHPLAKYMLEYRTLAKNHGTYITPLVQKRHVQDDGKIHSRISLYRTSTGRPASEEPNVQNFPKREHREIRRVIRASPGHKLAAFDFGQIEFRVIGMASKDKKLVDACWTGYDVHGHWLDRIVEAYPRWKRAKGMDTDKKRRRYARDIVKNQWTFPSLFGAALESRAGYLGIPEEYLVEVDEEFWRDFPEVKAWQQSLIDFYKKHRYVECLTGRRRHWGKKKPLTPNEIINMPIQGTASDIVVDAMERLDEAAIEYDEPWLAPVLNIMDDLTFDIPNSQLDEAIPFIGKLMCTPTFPWINVPLVVEVAVGKTWDALEAVKVFNSKDYGMRRSV